MPMTPIFPTPQQAPTTQDREKRLRQELGSALMGRQLASANRGGAGLVNSNAPAASAPVLGANTQFNMKSPGELSSPGILGSKLQEKKQEVIGSVADKGLEGLIKLTGGKESPIAGVMKLLGF